MPLCNISEFKKAAIVNSIQKGLLRNKIRIEQEGLIDRNGIGLMALNYIFAEMRKLDNLFDVYSFQRGPFSMVLLYDKESRALISFISQSNLKNLENRRHVSKVHYGDALVLFNKNNFEEPCQIGMFEQADIEEDRKVILDKILKAINEISPESHIFIAYDINHKRFQLCSVYEEVRSVNYYPVLHENWNKYIVAELDELEGVDNSSPKYDIFGEKRQRKGLAISIKPEILIKKN